MAVRGPVLRNRQDGCPQGDTCLPRLVASLGRMSLLGSNSAAAPRYYLSLGDSLATGVQPIGAPDRQFRTNEGYADQLHAIASARLPGL
jgi:hypothetical protein